MREKIYTSTLFIESLYCIIYSYSVFDIVGPYHFDWLSHLFVLDVTSALILEGQRKKNASWIIIY